MRRRGAREGAILAALREQNATCKPRLSDRQVRKIAWSIGRYPAGEPSKGDPERAMDRDGRPVIVVRGELTRETEESVAAIQRLLDHGLYIRGNQLVRVVKYRDVQDQDLWRARELDAPAVTLVGADALSGVMDRAAHFVRVSSKGSVSVYPPGRVVRQLLDRKLDLDLPPLLFVTETPLLTPAGTVTTEGYDPKSGILYRSPGPGYVPSDLREASPLQLRVLAQASAEALLDPAYDFPFTDNESRAVYLAAILTPFARPAIRGAVPPISVEAPTPGTGKTLLVKLISMITTGRAPGVTVMAEGEELRKRITSICLDGPPLVLLDNASGVVRSNVLAALFTTETWEDRLLGVNERIRVPNLSLWFITGNNIRFSGDLGRRLLPILLDSDLEDPENRQDFRHPDLLLHASQIRPQLVQAALTILLAHQLAGQPQHGKPRMGSFEAWDAQIRAAVVWATGWDPASTESPERGRGRIRAEANVDRENLVALLTALRRAFRRKTMRQGSRKPTFAALPFTAADVVQRYENLRADASDPLVEALTLAAEDRSSHVTAHSIGQALQRAHRQRVGRLKLEKVSAKAKGGARSLWRVVYRSPETADK
jgi:hypothetical protein